MSEKKRKEIRLRLSAWIHEKPSFTWRAAQECICHVKEVIMSSKESLNGSNECSLVLQ